MSALDPLVIDCHYAGREEVAAAFLLREGQRAAFIETNTSLATPRLLAALDGAGLCPGQVEWIIITHVHLDHAAGAASLLEACPNATLLAHPRAVPHVVDPARLIASAVSIYGQEAFEALYGEVLPVPAGRVRAMGDGESLRFGERTWTFLHTPGHAKHHFCIHDDALDAVFAGDNFGLIYPPLQGTGRLVFASTTPTDFDAFEAKQSIERIVDTGAGRVFVTHFGAYGDVTDIASQLIEQLDAFGAQVELARASDIPDADLDTHFSTFIGLYFDMMLDRHGVPKDDPRRSLLDIDRSLNAQGLAFAVKKQRYKARLEGRGGA